MTAKKTIDPKCPHGKRKGRCVSCGGSQLCSHSVAMVKLSLNADFVMALASVSTIEGEVFVGIVLGRVFALIIKKEHYALSAWVVLFARMVKEKINAQNVRARKFVSMESLSMVVYSAVQLYANIATTSIVVPIATVPKFVIHERNLTIPDVEP